MILEKKELKKKFSESLESSGGHHQINKYFLLDKRQITKNPNSIHYKPKREGLRELTIASVDPSMNHVVMSPFWSLRTLDEESSKQSPRPSPPPAAVESLALAPPAAAAASSIPAAIGDVLRVFRDRQPSRANGFGRLRRLRSRRDPTTRAPFDNKREEEPTISVRHTRTAVAGCRSMSLS